jgi:cholesterol oxidase
MSMLALDWPDENEWDPPGPHKDVAERPSRKSFANEDERRREIARWLDRGLFAAPAAPTPRFPIGLRQVGGTDKRDKGPVLLVHGASAASHTFLVPPGVRAHRDEPRGLAGFLRRRGWDVWLLDWRGSGLLSPLLIDLFQLPPERFTLDEAEHDLDIALREVHRRAREQKTPLPLDRIPVVGHCIGGALVAQAIANERGLPGTQERAERGPLQGVHDLLGNVVLTTLGLFFAAGLDDLVKGNERFLEKVWFEVSAGQAGPRDFFVSPWVADPRFARHHPWPKSFERAYQEWMRTPLPHDCDNEFCHRSCFLFGMPYRPDDMRELHDAPRPGGLWWQFGRMPLALYMHCVQNLRRGWAAPWHESDDNVEYLDTAENFQRRAVTLVTGNENQVWHRDSMDRMYEWLWNRLPLEARRLLRKYVLPGYGHQDLYWSANAEREVYPRIEQGLLGRWKD